MVLHDTDSRDDGTPSTNHMSSNPNSPPVTKHFSPASGHQHHTTRKIQPGLTRLSLLALLPSPSPSNSLLHHRPLTWSSTTPTCRPCLSSALRRAPSALPASSELRSSAPGCRPQSLWLLPAPPTSVPPVCSALATRMRPTRSSLPGTIDLATHWLRRKPGG
jgi:hypothetical protein